MRFFVIALIILQFAVRTLSQPCQNIRDVPVNVNEDYDDATSITGCISNASFPNEMVKMLGIDCSGSEGIEELPQNFLSHLAYLTEFVIDCSVKSIKPGAFAHLPVVRGVDISSNQLRSIPAGVFNLIPSLLYLNLSKNSIVFIEDFAFANLPRLADLDLSHNQLGFISRTWFTNTTSIEEFYIGNNSLKEIPERMFNGWEKTYAFNFDYNKIFKINDGAFKEMSLEINYLSLHHNQLTSINPAAFPGNATSILQLDLSSNLFNYLPLEFCKNISAKTIWIFGNPAECTCLKEAEVMLEKQIETVHSKLDAVEKCRRFDVPVCGLSPLGCRKIQDVELTSRITEHVRKMQFLDLKDWYEQCAILPHKTYLST